MSVLGSETASPWALLLVDRDGRRLEQTLRRSALVIPRDCALAVVVDPRDRFHPPVLSNFPPQRVAIQPENRGSAPAILYGLLRIMTWAPKSPVVVFPADHDVSNDASFAVQAETAIRAVIARPDLVILLGVMPDSADMEDGWTEPRELIADLPRPELHRARHFWKTLSARLAVASFVLVAYPSAVLNMVRGATPTLVDAFAPVRMRLGTPWEAVSLRQVYSRLPSMDFSKRVLGTCPANLAVLSPRQRAMSI